MATTVTSLTNRIRAGGFIQSEANPFRSRDEVCYDGSSGGGGVVYAGTVLGIVTASGKYVPCVQSASDGSQTPVAICWDDVDTTLGDAIGSVVSRDAEVRFEDLIWDPSIATLSQKQAKAAFLAGHGHRHHRAFPARRAGSV